MDVKDWLHKLGLEQYEQAFQNNAIDLDVLRELTADDLKDIGVTAVGHRRKLLHAISELRDSNTKTTRDELEGGPSNELEGERRQVTVLFADLSGYTAIGGDLDVEEIHTLLGRFFESVDRIVDEHGGHVDKHIGDCVMAVFGAPVAHSNDAERAVRAALAIRKAMAELSMEVGRTMRVHIGVASGQVVASSTGSTRHREYTVTGDSVNLASRLTEAAASDEILISELVRSALADRLDCAEKGSLTIKGFADPVPAWQLRDLRPNAPEDRPLIGRSRELHQLRAALDSCAESGHGQAIYLRGEAGIGKTRLVEEFKLVAREAGFAYHTGLVLDFGAGSGHDAVQMIVRSILGLDVGSGVEATQAAAERAREEGLVESDDVVFLNDLLDLPQPQEFRAFYDAMENATRSRGRRCTAARLISRASLARPLLLIVEDVHWANEVVLAHLAELTATVADCPVVLVMTTRIEGDPLDQAWRAQARSPLLTIDLGPLRPEEARALATSTLLAEEDFVKRCMERAAGNPLFLQQLLLHGKESAEIDIPGSVQSLVQARLDRLEEADKAALQAASVLGQQFNRDVLEYILKRSEFNPEPLVRNLLIRPQGENFLFGHALIRDAVYDSLLKRRRRELHRRAAEWFAGKDLLLHAEHLHRADDSRAARAYLEAARSQSAQYRYEVARRLVEQGIGLATDPADRFALVHLKGDIMHDLGDMPEAREAYEISLEFASDEMQQCRALIGLAAVKRVTEDLDGAFRNLEQAEAAAVLHGLVTDQARIHYLRGNLCFPRGDIDGCLREHGKSLELARLSGQAELQAAALGGLGDAEYVRGRMITAHERLRSCVELCRGHDLGRIEVANHAQIAHTMLYLFPQAEALKEALAAAQAASKVGHRRAEVNARLAAIFALMNLGQSEACRDEASKVEVLIDSLGAWRFEQPRLRCLGCVALGEGREAEATELLERALSVARTTGITFHGPSILGALALAIEDAGESRRALAEAEAIIQAGCVGHNELQFYPNAMEVALKLGDYDEVERYAAALEDFTRSEPLPWSSFFVARGRALAACGRGRCDAALMTELIHLAEQGERFGLRIALPSIQAALAGVPQGCC